MVAGFLVLHIHTTRGTTLDTTRCRVLGHPIRRGIAIIIAADMILFPERLAADTRIGAASTFRNGVPIVVVPEGGHRKKLSAADTVDTKESWGVKLDVLRLVFFDDVMLKEMLGEATGKGFAASCREHAAISHSIFKGCYEALVTDKMLLAWNDTFG